MLQLHAKGLHQVWWVPTPATCTYTWTRDVESQKSSYIQNTHSCCVVIFLAILRPTLPLVFLCTDHCHKLALCFKYNLHTVAFVLSVYHSTWYYSIFCISEISNILIILDITAFFGISSILIGISLTANLWYMFFWY